MLSIVRDRGFVGVVLYHGKRRTKGAPMDANAAERVGMEHLAAALKAGGEELLALTAREDLIEYPELCGVALDIVHEAGGTAAGLAETLREGGEVVCDGGGGGEPHLRLEFDCDQSPAAMRIVAAIVRAAEAAFASAGGESPRLDLSEANEGAAAVAFGLDAAAAAIEA